MNINYTILSKKTIMACSLQEIKDYVRIAHDYDDDLIKNLLFAATEYAENYIGIYIHNTKIKATIHNTKTKHYLKHQPIFCIESITKKTNKQDVHLKIEEQNIFILNDNKIQINVTSNDSFELVYTTGFSENNPLPYNIKQGILMHIALMYDGLGEAILPEHLQNITQTYKPYRHVKI